MSKFAALAVKADAPSRMTVLHPATGEPLTDADGNPAWIDVHSTDSPVAQRHQRAAQNRRLQSRARKITAEELEAEGVDLLAVLTADWRLLALDGTPLDIPCNRANAAELYAEPAAAWIREQVNVFAADRGNFLRT
jgi:hypothetical protein